MPGLLAVLCLLSALAPAFAAERDFDRRGYEPIEIEAVPVRFSRQDEGARYGRLAYRGGLALTSPDRRLGGLSGLGISADGSRIFTVSDTGSAFEMDLDYNNGHLSGVRAARAGRLRGSRGQPLPGKAWSDAEGVAFGPERLDGQVWVSFERRHRIETYDYGRFGLNTPARRIALPPSLTRLGGNSGVEAIVRLGPESGLDGALLVFGEGRNEVGRVPGHLVGGPQPGALTLASPDGYSVTDAAALANGDIVVLERYVGSLVDFTIQLRLIRGAAIRPGAHLGGDLLFRGGLSYTIDNFEGLAAHVGPDGEVRLTLVSDDNYSMFQRTLLLQFAIVPR